jgi:hypothetical protein
LHTDYSYFAQIAGGNEKGGRIESNTTLLRAGARFKGR